MYLVSLGPVSPYPKNIQARRGPAPAKSRVTLAFHGTYHHPNLSKLDLLCRALYFHSSQK